MGETPESEMTAPPSREDAWKREWLELAARLEKLQPGPAPGRVRALVVGYARALSILLYDDVTGGHEEEYADFPDAPDPERRR